MSLFGEIYLCGVVAAFTLFGVTLAIVCFLERGPKSQPAKAEASQAQTPPTARAA